MSVNPNVRIEFVIQVMNDGQIGVHGPINDKILSLGILELAKKAVMEFQPRNNGQPGIIQPDAF